MDKTIERLLRTYGAGITVEHGGQSATVFALLQPFRGSSAAGMQREVCALGEYPGGKYLYIGPASALLAPGDTLRFDESAYLVRQTDTVYYAGAPAYVRGLCTRKGEADTWGS